MKKNILFVDDELQILTGLQRTLRDKRNQWEMSFACGYAEAEEVLRNVEVDVAVMDINMPQKSGLDLLREIKSNPLTRNIEVIILTGQLDDKYKQRALELGATDLLNKPVIKENLVARLNSSLRLKQYHDELLAQTNALEMQLIQSQKMELIGQLSTGVVEDLQNILTGMKVYSEMLLLSLEENTGVKKNISGIHQFAERASDIIKLIRQLSLDDSPNKKMLDINPVAEESIRLLRHILDQNIYIDWVFPTEPTLIQADPVQITQLFLNLCMNAARSISDDGKLRIRLSGEVLEEGSEFEDQIILPGPHILIKVTDTGAGLDRDTLKQIFNPQFAPTGTKDTSGSMLTVAERIIRKQHGFLHIRSQVGFGSTFLAYLPVRQSGPNNDGSDHDG